MNRKNIILAGLLVVLAAACTKAPAEEQGGEENISGTAIPVSLEVSIGTEDPETRLTYELDGEGTALKSTWKKGDQISLITYDQNGQMMKNDVLTAESSGTSVKFTGTYSGSAEAGNSTRTGISIIYPALSGDPLASPVEPGQDYYTSGPYYIAARILTLPGTRKFIQPGDGSLADLPYYTLMCGSVPDLDNFLETGKFTTTLYHYTYIIKAELTLPSTHPDGESDYNITSVKINVPQSYKPFMYYGSFDFRTGDFKQTSNTNALQTYLGKIKSNGEVMGINCPRSSKVTVYFVGGFRHPDIQFNFNTASPWTITAYYLDGNLEEKTLTATKTIKSGIDMYSGNMYTMSAELKKVIEY
ncbi:MAG: hypothetical protein E7124_07465 [Bacteroidales bacterium]|nr:hypothetical protein [Bacteroidales bacterium]